jgi:intergrase/recombinase
VNIHDASRAERRAARERVSAYYDAELAKLLAHLSEAVDRYRAGELDIHGADDEIHRYSKAVRELWKFCWGRGVGSNMILVERVLRMMEEEGTWQDWWADAEERRHR